MSSAGLRLSLAGVELALLAEGALYWPARQALLVADLHLGKAAAYRRSGLAIPSGDTRATLERLRQLIGTHRPRELILLGDILHARLEEDSRLPAAIAEWRDNLPGLAITAIAGNHDHDLDRLSGILDIQPEGAIRDGLSLLHHPPQTAPATPWVAGHWHPVVTLAAAGDRLRLPAFIQEGETGLVLPAFGHFTGGWVVAAAQKRRRYVSSGERVYCIDAIRTKKSRR